MEVYTTDNDQVDAVRRFFSENGKALAVGVVLGIGALVGWRYWQGNQNTAMTEASSAYQKVSTALSTNSAGNVSADSIALAEKFIQGNKNNYGVLVGLELAHDFVEQDAFDKAAQQLSQALGQTKDENLLSLINLRLARVQLQLKKPDEALKTLDAVQGDGWTAMAQDVRGDALLSKGDTAGARAAYSKAIESNASQALQALLRMKLNNLSS
ncbi:YfgM family protein [Yersinia similis]|uniref:Ancillary SecYEG translocon subunit n=1 Tax=Yersinia similis TaxID=367190 RepID=A0A0T9PGZ0_9GAMM|nr:YfgM family protein [Yersinia similis]CNF18118.1 membrane protein [Yersinia similis]CNH64413.1 membrane protein [Yersinia similis]